MAREAQWHQFSWFLQWNDFNNQSQLIGDGVINAPGVTVVRIIGRAAYWYVNPSESSSGGICFAGIAMTGGVVDPIVNANSPVAGQRWKWWSSMIAVAPGVNETAGQVTSVGTDQVDFDVRGMQKAIPNEEWRLCWKLERGAEPGRTNIFMGTLRVCYLLPA